MSRHATPHPPAARAPTPARAAAEAGDGWPAPRGRRLALAAAGRADLAAVREHVDAACAAAGADAATRDALVLAADEVCANVLAHAYGDAAGPLTVDVAASGRDAGRVARVTVVDAGPAFDPRALAAADPVAPDTVAARPAGGFGWLLVCRSVDAVDYERAGPHNVLTLERRLDPAPTPLASGPPACTSPSSTNAT